MWLFFAPDFSQSGRLPPDELEHGQRVLRLRDATAIQVTDGQGRLYGCRWTATGQPDITSEQHVPPPDPHVCLCICPTKDPERMEWLLEKAVELGVAEVALLLSQRTDARYHAGKRLPLARWERIMTAALKQSQRCWLPKLHDLMPFTDFLSKQEQHYPEARRWVAHLAEGERRELAQAAPQAGTHLVLIGPEGDFTPEEIRAAQQRGFLAVQLGPHRLRTETAGLAALMTLTLPR